MTAHELARALLEMPDKLVLFKYYEPTDGDGCYLTDYVNSITVYNDIVILE